MSEHEPDADYVFRISVHPRFIAGPGSQFALPMSESAMVEYNNLNDACGALALAVGDDAALDEWLEAIGEFEAQPFADKHVYQVEIAENGSDEVVAILQVVPKPPAVV